MPRIIKHKFDTRWHLNDIFVFDQYNTYEKTLLIAYSLLTPIHFIFDHKFFSKKKVMRKSCQTMLSAAIAADYSLQTSALCVA